MIRVWFFENIEFIIIFFLILSFVINRSKSKASKKAEDMNAKINILELMSEDFSKDDKIRFRKLVNNFRTCVANPNIGSSSYLNRSEANDKLNEATEKLIEFYEEMGGHLNEEEDWQR
jgi:hypothetical protein